MDLFESVRMVVRNAPIKADTARVVLKIAQIHVDRAYHVHYRAKAPKYRAYHERIRAYLINLGLKWKSREKILVKM